MLDFPQINKPLSRSPIKGFLYYNNSILNSVKGRNDENSMIRIYNYIYIKNSRLKGLKKIPGPLVLSPLRGVLRSEARVVDMEVFKRWNKELTLVQNCRTQFISKVCPCEEFAVTKIIDIL